MVRRGTYSIVARDPQSGELGVAVQSHWFAVGPIVPWVRAGRGGGGHAVDRRAGLRPARARQPGGGRAAPATPSTTLVADDELARFRQVAVVDAHGNAAAYTGEGCIAHAGHQEGHEFSAQANMMGSPEVWPAMAHAFEAADGPAGPASARRAARRRGARRRRARAPVVRAGGRARAGRAVAAHASTCASTTIPSRWPSSTACSTSPTPTRWPPRATTSSARAATRRPGSATAAPARWRPATTSCSSGPAWPRRRRATCRRPCERVREAIRLQPGWRELLGRLDAEIAPGAPALREALEDAGEV